MNEEQHQLLREVHERTIRIDERTLHLIKESDDQEGRIRRLEKFKNWILGILGLGAAAGAGTNIHTNL